jgi:hypothetical protein
MHQVMKTTFNNKTIKFNTKMTKISNNNIKKFNNKTNIPFLIKTSIIMRMREVIITQYLINK